MKVINQPVLLWLQVAMIARCHGYESWLPVVLLWQPYIIHKITHSNHSNALATNSDNDAMVEYCLIKLTSTLSRGSILFLNTILQNIFSAIILPGRSTPWRKY